jgi:hypothetical protein
MSTDRYDEVLRKLHGFPSRLKELFNQGAPATVIAGQVAYLVSLCVTAYPEDFGREMAGLLTRQFRRERGICFLCPNDVALPDDLFCPECDRRLDDDARRAGVAP